jgi:hypothetical protein
MKMAVDVFLVLLNAICTYLYPKLSDVCLHVPICICTNILTIG